MQCTSSQGWGRRAALLLVVGLLTACGALPLPNAEGAPAQPLFAVVNMNTPEEVARSFLDAWNTQSYEVMYALVHPLSQEQYPLERFKDRYAVAHNAMGFSGVTYTIEEVTQQGQSAAVRYNATLRSTSFENIVDPNRTMRLVQHGGAWRVAWSPLDILEGLSADVRVEVSNSFPPRANIYDRSGNLIVQQGGRTAWIAVIKQEMRNVDECITLLAEVLLRPRAEIARLFTNYNPDTWFHVGELDLDVLARYRDALDNTCGLGSSSSGFRKVGEYSTRAYWGVSAMTHVTGFIGRVPGDQLAVWQARGYQASDLIGLAGVEASYESVLAGKPNRTLRMIEGGGVVLRELGGTSGAPSAPIQLTIDRDLQYATAKAMNDAFNYAQQNWASVATGAAAVVMDVNTGAILALHSFPTFDPSLFNPSNSYTDPLPLIAALNSNPRRPLANKAVAEQYTPGSVYKVFTALAVTDTGIWSPTTIFDCTLEWEGRKFGDTVALRQDWRVADNLPPAGEVRTAQALATSCNPFFWEMGGLMYQRDPNLLVRYSDLFGLGRSTGLTALGREVTGSVTVPRNASEAINNAIGQGDVQLTPLQLVSAVAAVANGGTLYQPYLVKQVGGFDGVEVIETIQPTVRTQIEVIDPRSFDVVREGMCLVTTDSTFGTAFRVFRNAPYSSCGKTGTAETGVRGSGSPPHAWYIAFAPAENPQIATVVVVTNSREGSEVAAPITRRILDFYFNARVEPFPKWWEEPYVPLQPPAGVAG